MSDGTLPRDIAASAAAFLAALEAQGADLPPVFAEVHAHFSGAMARYPETMPSIGARVSPATSLRTQPVQLVQTRPQIAPIPRRGRVNPRCQSEPLEDQELSEDFRAGVSQAPDSQTFYPLIDSANPLQPFFIFAPQLINNARKLAAGVQSVCPSIAVALESHIPIMLTITLTVALALIIALTIELTGALTIPLPIAHTVLSTFTVPVPLAHLESEDQEDDTDWRQREEEAQRRRGTWTGLKITIPPLRGGRIVGGAGHGGGGGGAGRGGPPAHLWTEDCVRRGDRKCTASDANIGMMPCGAPDCSSCQGAACGGGHENEGEDDEQRNNNNSQTGQRKCRKVPAGWRIEPSGGPPVTKCAGELLGKLLAIYGRQNRLELDDLLVGTTSELPVGNDMAAIVQRLSSQSKALKVGELQYMLALVQLVLHVDSLKADAKLKYLRKVTVQNLAEKYAPGTHPNTFRDWVNWGKRLLLLCAAGTCYILPIIAALDLRTNITRKSTTESDVLSLATALREVRHGKWLPMVRRLMVPIYYLRSTGGYIQDLRLHYPTPVPDGQSPKTISFGFGDIQSSDEIFDRIETNYPKLLPRSSEWDFTAMPAWKPLEDPRLLKLTPVHVIQTPLLYKKSGCPVTKKNRNKWTDAQRKKAEGASVATDLQDLEDQLSELHEGGTAKLGSYVEISSKILDGHALRINDSTGKLLSFLFTVPPEYRQLLSDAILRIHECMPGEFKDEDSRAEFFKYLSCHYSWYAQYVEKGGNAPKGGHPDKMRKDHKGRVNFEQRYPHPSKDMGNVNDAYTWAHRDKGDKHLCLVIPFGSFTGGQLCLYETGFSFDLQLGDVLIFPLCDLTHFNLHFSGQRGTLVLHSDRQGDSWFRDYHGWSSFFVRHS
ncbi:hypothetical protein B0H17DRAFT_1124715 [Mycena rosella]|uniref:Uncharacterized protein n=1 Tax=Mycena rosella TaxID=1033263 RepID=A0AAD7GZR0_MYCRO|nr:hypothetical protein B0H17DRAFT_1124715 [Mycena rosella]